MTVNVGLLVVPGRTIDAITMGVRVRGRGGGGQLPSQIRAKEWGKIRAKQEECVKFRVN